MGRFSKEIEEIQRRIDIHTEDVEMADRRRPSESAGSHDLTEHKRSLVKRLWDILAGYKKRNGDL